MGNWAKSRWCWGVLIALLTLAAYWRSLTYPFIADDYIQIRLGRIYGDPENIGQLLADPLYRCRATSLYLTAATERLFGLMPEAYNASSVLLHVLNALLVLALLRGLRVPDPAAVAAAGFFAVYEGHQEAVIWYAALPEQLVLTFSLAALIQWRRWWDEGHRGAYVLSLGLFAAALFSKESSVAAAPLLFWVALWRGGYGWRRAAAGAAPFLALAAVYAVSIFAARQEHQFFSDGTFTPGPHVLVVLPHTMLRMLFFWGALAAVVAGRSRTLLFSLAWIAITLLPYSFLTYMPRVPSRHTYFPAVGLALLVGTALVTVWMKWGGVRRRWLVPALASLIVVHNCVYLWTRKHRQYLERAAPTESVLEHLRDHRDYRGRVWVMGFPYDAHVLYSAVAVATDRSPDSVIAGEPPSADAHMLLWDDAGQRIVVNPGKPSRSEPAAH